MFQAKYSDEDCNFGMSVMNWKKRGQATVFIILGLAILLAIGIVAYLNIRVIEPSAISPEELSSVQLYVESCLQKTANDALSLAGKQGGYVYLNQFPPMPAGINFGYPLLTIYNGAVKIPYWFYQDSSGIDKLQIPQLSKQRDGDNSIQDQLETYVEQNINNCLQNFKDFPQTVIQEASPRTQVTFGNKEVLFSLNMPLTIEDASSTKTYDNFIYNADVAFKDIYNLAKEITEGEKNSFFLEQHMMEQITLSSGINKNRLPPLAGLTFGDCSDVVFWTGEDVRNKFANLLSSRTPFIQITNAEHEKAVIDRELEPDENLRKLRQGALDKFLYETSGNIYGRLKTRFSFYNHFPLNLDLGGEFIRPESQEVNLLVNRLCLYTYDFFYTFNFPILISVIDEESSFNGGTYYFQFPIEVVVQNNFPRHNIGDIFGIERNEKMQIDEVLCNTANADAGLSLEVYDSKTGQKIENVKVESQCGPEKIIEVDRQLQKIEKIHDFAPVCFIGLTDGQGALKQDIPSCLGEGALTLSKKDYVKKRIVLDEISTEAEINQRISLTPKSSILLEGRKHSIQQLPHFTLGRSSEDLIFSERGVLLECRPEEEGLQIMDEETLVVQARNTLDPSESFYASLGREPYEIKLAPGTYEFDVMLIKEVPPYLNIQPNSERIVIEASLPWEDDKIVNYPEEEVELNSTITGGSKFTLTITQEDLNKRRMIIPVIDEGIPRLIENVGTALLHRETCYQQNQEILTPEFI